jgi:hypothetical protein
VNSVDYEVTHTGHALAKDATPDLAARAGLSHKSPQQLQIGKRRIHNQNLQPRQSPNHGINQKAEIFRSTNNQLTQAFQANTAHFHKTQQQLSLQFP